MLNLVTSDWRLPPSKTFVFFFPALIMPHLIGLRSLGHRVGKSALRLAWQARACLPGAESRRQAPCYSESTGLRSCSWILPSRAYARPLVPPSPPSRPPPSRCGQLVTLIRDRRGRGLCNLKNPHYTPLGIAALDLSLTPV